MSSDGIEALVTHTEIIGKAVTWLAGRSSTVTNARDRDSRDTVRRLIVQT